MRFLREANQLVGQLNSGARRNVVPADRRNLRGLVRQYGQEIEGLLAKTI